MDDQPAVTWQQMCQTIADDWNREQLERKPKKDCIILTADDIWGFDLVGEFPAIYVPIMYDAAIKQDLLGLLITDNTVAGMFFRYLAKMKKDKENGSN
jgi:hypothetical protein